VVHYRAAAEQDFAPAQAALGQAYFDGAGVARNQQTAFNWFWESAVQGNGPGQHWTGHIYRLRRQFDQALKWIRKAAEHCVASAQISMVKIYGYEIGGMTGSNLEAAKWAERAAR
jgi:TPR repeat protein